MNTSSSILHSSLLRALPWLVAAACALGALFLGLGAAAARQEAEVLRVQLELRELELRDARNRSAVERVILERQIETGRSPAVTTSPGAATKN